MLNEDLNEGSNNNKKLEQDFDDFGEDEDWENYSEDDDYNDGEWDEIDDESSSYDESDDWGDF